MGSFARDIVRCVLASFVAVALALLLTFVLVAAGLARDLGQWSGSDPEISSWYKGLRQPDNPALSCCGEADAYWADKFEVIDGKVYATITDDRDDAPLGRRHIPNGTRFEIPVNKIMNNGGNPTGHVVIFINPGDQVLCYVTGTLS